MVFFLKQLGPPVASFAKANAACTFNVPLMQFPLVRLVFAALAG